MSKPVNDENLAPVNQQLLIQGERELHGFDAELAKKLLEKWDPEMERKACTWIEQMTNEKVLNIEDGLRNGVILCKLANSIKAGIIPKIDMRAQRMCELANIKQYLEAITRLGLPKNYLFDPHDLYDKKFLPGVLQHIYAVGRMLANRSHWVGPRLETYTIEPSWVKASRQGSESSIEELFKKVAVELSLNFTETSEYLNVLIIERIRTVDHLRAVHSNRSSWDSLSLPEKIKLSIAKHLKDYKVKEIQKTSYLIPFIIVTALIGGFLGYQYYTKPQLFPTVSVAILNYFTKRFRAIK